MPKTPTINLGKGRGQTFVDRFLAWALSVGRVIVILTEGIALGAFLYRFDLDRQIIDLHSKINQEQIIVNLLNKNENTFRNLQQRLHIISVIGPQADRQVTLFTDLFSAVPQGVSLEILGLSSGVIQIEATSQSSESLSLFLRQLQAVPEVANVSVDRIENKTTIARIIITISGRLKGAQAQAL